MQSLHFKFRYFTNVEKTSINNDKQKLISESDLI
jgi:hypothetical protein